MRSAASASPLAPQEAFGATFWTASCRSGRCIRPWSRAVRAEAAGVREVALLAAEEGELEVADRHVGDTDFGAQVSRLAPSSIRPGDDGHLAAEDEGDVWQAAVARDRVGGPSSGFSSSGVSSLAVPIGWRPAHCSVSSSALEQMLPRWRWSISKAFGRVTAIDLMLASPARVSEVELQARVLARAVALLAAELGDRHLRLEGEGRAVDRVEVGAEVGHRALVADPLRGDRERDCSWSG